MIGASCRGGAHEGHSSGLEQIRANETKVKGTEIGFSDF